MFNLSVKTLGDICDEGDGIIRTGPFGSQLHQSDYTDIGIPVVMPKDITEDRVNDSEIARISEEDALRLSQHQLMEGDVVYGRRGDIGRHALISAKEEGWLCGTGCLRIHLGSRSPLNPFYLHYYLKQRQVIEWIYNQAIGATMPNLNTSILRSVIIRYPRVEIQHKIAAILSAYDNLIENNLSRIKILEEMAQTLYREWFVKFRFPCHQKVKTVNCPLGQIPEGWRVTGILECPYFDFIGQNIHPYEGKKVYYATADIEGIQITGKGIEYEYNEKPIRAQKQPELNSVWFARMQDTYKVVVFTSANVTLCRKCMLSSGFAGLRSVDNLAFGFLFYTINSKDFHQRKDLLCTGATQRSLTNEGLGRINVVVPPRDLVERFGDVTQPSIDQILILFREISILREARQLLLPKLISGELDVSELDITIPEANA